MERLFITRIKRKNYIVRVTGYNPLLPRVCHVGGLDFNDTDFNFELLSDVGTPALNVRKALTKAEVLLILEEFQTIQEAEFEEERIQCGHGSVITFKEDDTV